jgi:SAM-dependent methyltransferase
VNKSFAQQDWFYEADLAQPMPVHQAALLAAQAGVPATEPVVSGPAELAAPHGHGADCRLIGIPQGSSLQHAKHPGWILDIGCGTGRLPAKIASVFQHAHVVGVDASVEMIRNTLTAPAAHRVRFAATAAEQLPVIDGLFDLVVVTLSLSHWGDKAAGLAEISRVMAPSATLLVADVIPPARPSRPITVRALRRQLHASNDLPSLIAARGLRVEHVAPIRSVALVVDVALIAAKKPC